MYKKSSDEYKMCVDNNIKARKEMIAKKLGKAKSITNIGKVFKKNDDGSKKEKTTIKEKLAKLLNKNKDNNNKESNKKNDGVKKKKTLMDLFKKKD